MFLINFKDNVESVKPITGTKELKKILSNFLIKYQYIITTI